MTKAKRGPGRTAPLSPTAKPRNRRLRSSNIAHTLALKFLMSDRYFSDNSLLKLELFSVIIAAKTPFMRFYWKICFLKVLRFKQSFNGVSRAC